MQETIYVVDDSTMNLNIAKSVLEEHYQVFALSSAMKMFASLEKIVPDLILLDIVMPEMDGFEALKLLKTKHADIPVIFLTSSTDAAVEARGFQMGVIDFITKPFSAPVLVNRIKKHLERTQQLQENKKLLLEIEQKRREADNANKAKSSFLSRMSHEIRTPMNAILGIAEIQLQEESLELKIREAFERIYASGDLLLGIINDILDLSKIEAGRMELVTGKYEIASLISDAAQLNMMRIGSKPISFELKIDEHLPAVMMGDELRVKQILNNILSNAFKYTASGTVTLNISAQASTCHENEILLIISVIDTGQGMSKEQVSKLFDEYSRFNQEANRATEGTGLGMSIMRDLVNLMKGSISIKSEPGHGSAFTVCLPQGKCGSEELGKEMAENLHKFRSNSRTQMKRTQITREPMPYGKILVVDDVETNIYVAKGLLAPYELSFDSADSGYAAIEKIKNGKTYDVIFMDHMMPKLDGVETTKILRSMGYALPIVALTANAVTGQAGIFLENGFTDFISKPIDIRQMNRILNEQIRDRQTAETLEAARIHAAKFSAQKADEPHHDKLLIDPQSAETFLHNIEKSLTALIEKSGSYEDLQNYMLHMQTVKNALENTRRKDLYASAYKLEQAAHDNITALVMSETPAFLQAVKAFTEALARETSLHQTAGSGASVLKQKQITGIDIVKGLERYHDDEKSFIMILRSYTASVRSMLEAIKTVSADTLAAYEVKVHGIKGASREIFALDLAKKAEALEKAAVAGDFDFVSKNHLSFLEDAWALINNLDAMLSDIDSQEAKPKKDKPDSETLLKLRAACEIYDLENADAAMSEIEKYQYESDGGLVEFLRKNFETMQFGEIVKQLSK
ncbi:MAG: response regulator [Treponema sp.]|nr:response regulator [Treponema sp.]MCL2273191.1 response regulator [Treponema sp.]